MRKFEDDAIEFIKAVAENHHHNEEKPLIRGETPKGGIINPKLVETCMLLERNDKMAKVPNLILNRLYIRNGFEGLTPVALKRSVTECPLLKTQPCLARLPRHGNSRASHV